MMKLDIQMFADGKVVITADLDSRNFEKGLSKIENATNRAGSTVKNIIAGLGISKLIAKGINLITGSMDTAITRLDTLNNFPKVMSNLGISTEKSQKSIDKLADKLQGLPTTLQDGALAVQRFTSANSDIDKSTDLFLALNNAILAGGASTEIQSSALEQLSQAYAKGRPDMMEWRTAMMAMPAQLKQVATAMGYVNADELGSALRDGTVSMDAFMDTITRLNVEGVDGFKSFEEQAKNSTEGIRTSITVLKGRVAQGLTSIIDSIDKGLKKSGMGGISELIVNFANSMRETLKKVGKQIEKIDFKKLINTAKKLIPVIGSLTAGFIAYNGAIKGLKLANTISNFVKLAQKSGGLLTSINGLKGGMIALNSTMALSPIGLLVAGVVGLTAGFYLLAKAEAETSNETAKINKTLYEYDKVMEEANKTRQEYLDTNMNEIQNTQNLFNELQALVDENGRVKAGYEDRVNYITGELSKALGIEITTTDGVIQNYQNLRQSIDDVIASKRIKTLLDAQEGKYNDAKDRAVKLEEAYSNAIKQGNRLEEERKDKLKAIQQEYGLTKKQLDEVAKSYGYTTKEGKFVSIAFDEMGKSLMATNSQLTINGGRIKETGDAYAENQKVIADYEQALKYLADGNYEAISQMYEDTTNYHAKTNTETQANYDSAIESQKQYLQFLKDNKNQYDQEVYNSQVKATQDRIKQLEEEQKKMSATISTGQTIIKGDWQKGIAEQLSELTGHKIDFKKTADGHIQAYIDGQKEGRPRTKKEAKQLIKELEEEMKKVNTKPAGENMVFGVSNGINSQKGSAFATVSSFGKSLLGTLQSALQEHSPSKATEKMGLNAVKGFEIGFDKEQDKALKQIDNFGNDLLKRMTTSVNLEMSKLNANVETGKVFNTLANTTPIAISLDADVEMDKTKVGRIITPVVSETLKTGGLR